ncbi:RNA polymerase sigma-70 factor, ECF subfamily [Candidatus Magnetomoraceae bacterium gMMP-1]
MPDKNYQIVQLVEQAETGKRSALNKLVDIFHDDIFRMVYYRCHSLMDAEDLTQEIFMQMCKKLHLLKDAACFKSWLFSMAVNRIKDFYKKKKILSFFGSTTEMDETSSIEKNDNPVNSIMQKEFWKQFKKLTDSLSQWEREVFILRFVDQLGIREIAEVLKKNESTIKTHLYRALKKVKENPLFHELLNDFMTC